VSDPRPDALEAFTVALLRQADQYLLLQRAQTKAFMPGRWTGIGGRVEVDEFDDLRSAALRELREETGIPGEAVARFLLRRVLLVARPGRALTVLLYFSGCLDRPLLPECKEGSLAWVRPEQFDALDVIESTKPVLPLLAGDQERDPEGLEPVRLGVGTFRLDGTFKGIVWGD
jgi:8-oxo-dGTP diphosphatase